MPDEGWLAAIGRRPWLGLVTAVIVVALDQWTKQIAVSELEYRIPVMVTSWFDWMLTYNTAPPSVFWLTPGVAALVFDRYCGAVSVFIVVWLFRLNPADRGLVLPLGLILGAVWAT